MAGISVQSSNLLTRLGIVQVLLAFYIIGSSFVTATVQERNLGEYEQAVAHLDPRMQAEMIGWSYRARRDSQWAIRRARQTMVAGIVLLFVSLGQISAAHTVARNIPPNHPALALPRESLAALLTYLSFVPLVALWVFVLDEMKIVNLLDDRHHPAFGILAPLSASAAILLGRRVAGWKIWLATMAFSIPVWLPQVWFFFSVEVFSAANPLWFFLVVVPLLVGTSVIWKLGLPWPVNVGYLILGAYIGAIHMFNAFYPNWHINFFGNGWTA